MNSIETNYIIYQFVNLSIIRIHNKGREETIKEPLVIIKLIIKIFSQTS